MGVLYPFYEFFQKDSNIITPPSPKMPVEVEKIRSKTVNIQSFLDSTQYSVNGVTRYERVFGEDFISTGLGSLPGHQVMSVRLLCEALIDGIPNSSILKWHYINSSLNS